MTLKLGTHSGTFHADDVLAAALIQTFLDADASVVRTRDKEVLATCDIVFDVGGVFDKSARRFDHHQREYEGTRSSAGMVLDHLEENAHVSKEVAARLREELVDYVDAVDIGARIPEDGVPCFSSLVGMVTENAIDDDFDREYFVALSFAKEIVRAIKRGYERAQADAAYVLAAMKVAEESKSKAIVLEAYKKWKPAYFENGGESHETHFVLFPDKQGWRIVTIPKAIDLREDKQKLPEAWAGLEGAALEEACGIEGARFCHKNAFTAGFKTKEGALFALEKFGLLK